MSGSSSNRRPKLSEFLTTWSPEKAATFLAGIYEHSAWVAETLVQSQSQSKQQQANEGDDNDNDNDKQRSSSLWEHNLSSIGDLAKAMRSIVDDAPHETQLTLLRAHPDLAAKVDDDVEAMSHMTKSSQEEQSSAGLQTTLTDDERRRFTSLNHAYKTRFQFPFILAVRNATKYTVLAALEGRLSNPAHVEFAGALRQVHKIAWMRLLAAIDVDNRKGFLTCHVLDTANGCPGTYLRTT
jgi:2-oxo-4-hydroxy-4-carboxy-5-ureidoimidazoline decarboxylase